MEQKIKTIIITHKDRFIRFGYDWFEKFCMKFHTTIVIVNNEELSPQDVKELQDGNQSHTGAENQDSKDDRHLPICL